ncbi:MAG: thiamine pyrophosphate-dependent dehydrogenase E1 component subunit alpha [Candidatus Atabeyarchaeum deiterrae]
MKLEKNFLLDMYRKVLELRLFEEKVYELFGQNLIPGTIHLYLGEEASAVGICSALRQDDYIQSTHRGHGHCIAKGADLGKMMAEIMGKGTGYCKGKGGSMHVTDFDKGILGATGVVGSGLPLAVGAGLSAKMKGTDQVVAVFFGEGASNQGTFHESLNLASVWKLPVLFVCENNLYAMGTRQSIAMVLENVADRASAYGMPGVIVDGNDVVDVYRVASEAVRRARKGEGPTLIETKTYRLKGHSRFDPATYRPKEEVEEWIKRDAVKRMRDRLLDERVAKEDELKKIEDQVKLKVEEASKFAKESPQPEPTCVCDDVYAD